MYKASGWGWSQALEASVMVYADNRRPYDRGFTLVELLVVIAVVAALAAILLPVFAAARASARNTQDLSGIRQIGLALMLYAGDNDERYVPVGSWNDPTITPLTHPNGPAPGVAWNGWALKLAAYTRNREMFRSPFMPAVATWWTGPCAAVNGMRITSTYAYNWFLGADDSYVGGTGEFYNRTPSGTALGAPLHTSDVEAPAQTMALQLSQTTSPYGNDFACIYNFIETPDWDNKIRFRAVYNGGGNLAFSDGHARFLPAKEADSTGTGYPACGGAPSHTIYIWRSRGLWAWPRYPSDDGGFPLEPVREACAQ
jgi:prepilin-type N-terminal cleavage/methylation domain-containing protein/prepilin-type processing-associated H-X9-DG protein